MGAQQSTRKLTLDNDDPTNVIKVSDAVVDRLRGNAEARDSGASTSTTIPETSVPARGFTNPIYPQYMYEASQTSLQLRQEKEMALQKNDDYWQKRINQLEENHQHMNKLMEQEYNDAVDEVKSGFLNYSTEQQVPRCNDSKKAVIACYKKYPNEPMRCARQVQAFAACVDQHRRTICSQRT